jgi:hypothetical protein
LLGSSRRTLSGIPLPRFLNRSRTQRSSVRVEVWKLTPFPPSKDRSALTVALNPSAVDGTTINFSPFSWAVRPGGPQPGQEGTGVAHICNKNGGLVGPLAYGSGTGR